MNLKTHVGVVQSAPHCPFCRGLSRVAFMRVDAEGRLHRRRVCVNGGCRRAFWTVEASLTRSRS